MLCLATLIEKVTYQVLMEIMSATIDLFFFSFQIRVSNAVVVPVHHSSFGSSTHILVYISFCEWCWKAPLHSHTCLNVTYQVLMEITSATIYSNLFFPFHSRASSALGKNRRIWTRSTLTKYYIINYKCISGLPSFLWPRFPLTHNKPVVGHASTVITSEVGEGSGRTGTCKPHDSRTSFGGSWG